MNGQRVISERDGGPGLRAVARVARLGHSCTARLAVLLLLLCAPSHATELSFTTNPHAAAMIRSWNAVKQESTWVATCREDTTRTVQISKVRVFRRGPQDAYFRQIAILSPGEPMKAEAYRLTFQYGDSGLVYVVQERRARAAAVRSCPSNRVMMR